MSTFDNENIDRLFDSLEDHSMDVEFDQFSDMEIRLESMRYFRFGWKHFNIYYTGIIGVTFALSSYMFIDYLRSEPIEKKVVMVVADTTAKEEAPVIEAVPTFTDTKKPIRKANPSFSLARLADSSLTKVEEPLVVPPAPAPPPPVVDSVPKAPRPKRIVVIPKRDTIIKYDTTKVVKRK
jgi:hypothetical protein